MIQESGLIPWIVLLPLLGALINGIFGKRMSKGAVTFFAIGSVAMSFVLSVIAVWRLASSDAEAFAANLWTWADTGTLTVSVSFLLDELSSVMLLVVTGVGSLIHIFSIGYMRKDPSYYRYFAYLNLFMFSMLLLIMGKNLLVLFVGWEGVGVCSYLLIGFWFKDMDKAVAGKKAFLVNRIGDFAFLLGMFILLFYTQGELDFLRLEDAVVTGDLFQRADGALRDPITLPAICILFLIGATGKSAQIPLYVWLPDAMAGPTPVSALIHAATMVTAGVYLMVRMNFMFSLSEVAMATVAWVGGLTALFAATIALVQNDIKKVLAYSTVSQIGFMVMAVGVGAYVAAIFHLMTHAFFKACLFLGSGSVIHAMHHEQDIRNMGGLKEKLPITRWTFFISCLAIAGIPLFSGFFSKDEILFNTFTSQYVLDAGSQTFASPQYALFAIAAIAAFCTAFYMFRLYYLTFEGTYRGDKHTWDHAHEEKVMNYPLIVLAFLATVGGFIGIPAAFGLPHVLHHWLEPVVAPGMTHFHYSHDHALEWILMGVSTAIAIAGVLIARKVYKVPSERLPEAPTHAWWHRVLTNKYYVDEFYDFIIVRPIKATAKFCYEVIDVKVIDGLLVRGPAIVLGKIGELARNLQNGDVQAYVTTLVVGLAAILLIFV